MKMKSYSLLAAAVVGSLVAATGPAIPAVAAPAAARINLNVLVLDDGSPMVGAIADRLSREGQPITRVDLKDTARPRIDAAYLAESSTREVRGRFSGVVQPNEAPAQLAAGERSVLNAYQEQFGVRSVAAYTSAHPEVGLNPTVKAGPVDGMTASVTEAGKAGPFSYLSGTVRLDDISPSVSESYGYLATPRDASFVPLITTPIPGSKEQGSLMGVHTAGGREQLVITFASNAHQQHWKVLSHGVVTWLTQGVSLTYQRNYFSAHVDDVFMSSDLWNVEGNCIVGATCDPKKYPEGMPGGSVRMIPSDVSRLRSWQRKSGIYLDMTFNGFGVSEYVTKHGGRDPLERALLASKHDFRWLSHTWSHAYLGCKEDTTQEPWRCAVDSAGRTLWASPSLIHSEIDRNNRYAASKRLPNYRSDSLVTGKHSGLKSLPQMPTDNPYLAQGLDRARIRWVASDSSREFDPRTIGRATTVPRYPMNIFYNTATKEQAVDEYNWIYTSAADGGSGLCEKHPDIMTCIKPLDLKTGFDTYIVDIEARHSLSHALDNDARPHFLHQANLAADGVIYPVIDRMLADYRGIYAANTPVLNPTMAEAGREIARQHAWKTSSGNIQAVLGGQTLQVRNTGSGSVEVPLTLPEGARQDRRAFGSSYAGQRSGLESIKSRATRTYQLPGKTRFATTVTWPVTPKAPAGTPDKLPVQTPTRVVKLPEAEETLPMVEDLRDE